MRSAVSASLWTLLSSGCFLLFCLDGDLLRRGGLRVLRGDSASLRFLGASGDLTGRLRMWGFERWRERLRDDEDEDRRR